MCLVVRVVSLSCGSWSQKSRVSELKFENGNESALLCVVEVKVGDEVNKELSRVRAMLEVKEESPVETKEREGRRTTQSQE